MTKDEDMLFDTIELETPSNTDTSVVDIIDGGAPSITDPEWNDYVMSLFTKKEMYDGNPLVAGLRRVAELVLGTIVYSGPTQVFPPQRDDHHGRATVVFTVEFENGMKFSEVADCWEGNTDDMFCAYAIATASTRAEGRALRKALRIRAVAAEEMTKKDTAKIVRDLSAQKDTSDGGYDDSSRMSDAQYNFIDVKCRQLGINGAILFKTIFSVDNNRKISKKVASDIIDRLNEYQRDKSTIPEEVLGYVEEWRNQ
ncbi:MAG: hypothetical protein CL833_05645 [Crocinitomicaceae bacterium]|nr:hypothetical protein [Crocinitomicaceae bacterium]|tara:strand:+ start:3809 stop:4573 length:765 start_codon:yes stop_codon:yes gene_type:complete